MLPNFLNKLTGLFTIIAISILDGLFQSKVDCRLNAPSFISPWSWMDTANESSTQAIYEHGFNENPIKAEVQVKHPNSSLMFSGIHTANVIKVNQSYIRAGVMCIYNSTHVVIMGPPSRGQIKGYLIFSGSQGQWTGPGGTVEQHQSGYVRVRVWHRLDFPDPDLTVFNVELNSKHSSWSGKHNILNKLLFASVQLTLSDGWIAEAQGSDSQYDVTSSSSIGVVFAATKLDVALWSSPMNNSDGYVFTHYGWGSCTIRSECSYTNGNVTIRLWGNMTSFSAATIRTNTGQHIKYVDNFDSDSDILEVFTDVDYGNSVAASFPASGTAMMDSRGQPLGLVYGIDHVSSLVHLWYPTTKQGSLVQIDSVSFMRNTGTVGVVIWKGEKSSDMLTDTTMPTFTNGSTGYITSELTTSGVFEAMSNSSHSISPPNLTTNSFQANMSTKRSGTTHRMVSNSMNTRQSPTTINSIQSTENSSNFTKTSHVSSNLQPVTHSPATTISTSPPLKKTTPTLTWSSQTFHTACTNKNRSTRVPSCVKLETGRVIQVSDLGRNVYVDFSFVNKGFLLFTCKTGYVVKSGDFNRTLHERNNTLTGQPSVCTERQHAFKDRYVEQRTKQIVKNLTVSSNNTSKYRRDHESARDDRMTSKILGIIGGMTIGSLILLLIMGDVVRLIRYLFL